jgi:hypothetical protein
VFGHVDAAGGGIGHQVQRVIESGGAGDGLLGGDVLGDRVERERSDVVADAVADDQQLALLAGEEPGARPCDDAVGGQVLAEVVRRPGPVAILHSVQVRGTRGSGT